MKNPSPFLAGDSVSEDEAHGPFLALHTKTFTLLMRYQLDILLSVLQSSV